MWYWFYEIASVTLVIGLVALILWWAWRQETAGRFADTLDRRFAKEKPKVKWWRTKDWPESTLEQRVTALEQRVQSHQSELMILAHRSLTVEEQVWNLLEAATPSPASASPTTDCPSGVPERDYTPRLSPASWRSGQPTTTGGLAAQDSDSAQETGVPT